MRFGECLIQLAEKAGWKRSEVVIALTNEGIDRSLVYRWLRNERIPKLNSGDREAIVACLGLSQADCGRLVEAQMKSLLGTGSLGGAGAQEEISRMLGGIRQANEVRESREVSPLSRSRPTLPVWRALEGSTEVGDATISLLESVPECPPPGNEEILITSLSDSSFNEFTEPINWSLPTLRTVLQRGYTVSHLLRLDANARRSVRIVEYMLAALGNTGSYQPRYLNQYGTPLGSHEMLIVPPGRAMMSFTGQHPNHLDVAILLNDPLQIKALRAHFMGLRARTKPLLKPYRANRDGLEYLEAFLRAEEKEGDFLISKPGLSFHTTPYCWYQHGSSWAESASIHNVDLPTLIDLSRRRLDAFYRQVENYQFREICPKNSVVRLVRNGEGTPYGQYRHITPEDRLRQIENTITLLQSFENYELILTNESEEGGYITPGLWLVKWNIGGDPTVLLEVRSPRADDEDMKLGLEIMEPVICNAFRLHFMDILENRISPLSKEKREVISFLQSQVSWLKGHMQTA